MSPFGNIESWGSHDGAALAAATIAPGASAAAALATAPARGRGRVPAYSGQRYFEAGKFNRKTNDWPSMPLSADNIIYRNLRTLVARSREQFINNDYAERYIGLLRNNVIGSEGILFRSRLKNDTQDINGYVTRSWRDWGRPVNCDVGGRLSWKDMQDLFITTVAIDGEFLATVDNSPEMGPYRFGLNVLDPQLLDLRKNQAVLSGGGYIRMGIEFDARGRRAAYWIVDPAQLGVFSTPYVGKSVRWDADRVIHEFLPEMPGQSRGFPWMSTPLGRLRMLGGAEEASLTAMRVGASDMMLIETAPGEGDYIGDAVDPLGMPEMDVEPGQARRLMPGEKVSSWKPAFPNGETPGFTKLILRGIAGGLGVNYNSLANDLEGVNYGSLRAGAQDERDGYMSTQGFVISRFCRRCVMEFLRAGVTWGGLNIPAGLVPAIQSRAAYQGRRWQWIDPLKEAQGIQLQLANRTTTPQRIVESQGYDWDETVQELSDNVKQLDAAGIPLEFLGKGGTGTPAASDASNEEEGGANAGDKS